QETPGKTLNAVFLGTITGSWGPSASYAFLFITLVSEAAILFVAAQAGFFGGPRVLANMALDRWFPSKFAMLSDRLVTQNGVLLMGGTALVTLILTRGAVAYLIVLYSITVFITFVLATLGMVRYWWRMRGQDPRWKRGLALNSLGLTLTSTILVAVSVIKFTEGGWITLLVTGALVTLAIMIRRHYNHTLKLLKRLDMLVPATEGAAGVASPLKPNSVSDPVYYPEGKTAVVLVNGFNGLGLHTLFSIIRLFGDSFKNYVFVQVGIVDAGNFKGSDEIGHLEKYVQEELDRYVNFMKTQGKYAERFYVLGTDIVDEIHALAPKIQERFPNSVFFGGQIVFPEETLWSRWLHNYIVFAVQRKLYSRGIPFMVLPIRV
nr:amino acid transporter [Candidatus Hydrogenedentota bacterium]